MKLIHTSPLGALIIAGIGDVEPGTPFDVDEETGEQLLEQSDLYRPATPLEELRREASALGIDTTGLKKADIQEAIANATAADTEGASA